MNAQPVHVQAMPIDHASHQKALDEIDRSSTWQPSDVASDKVPWGTWGRQDEQGPLCKRRGGTCAQVT
jgi:hypothetical protein